MTDADNSIHLYVSKFCHFSLTWYFGFIFANYFVYCQFFFDWFISFCLIHYFVLEILDYLYQKFIPQELKSDVFNFVFVKLISICLTSLIFGQPSFLMLFAFALYWLFTFYSRLFAKMPIESLSLSYYFSSLVFLIPVLLNVLFSSLVFFGIDLRHQVFHDWVSILGIKSLGMEWGFNFFQKADFKKNKNFSTDAKVSKIKGLNLYQQEHYQILKKQYFFLQKENLKHESLTDLKRFIAKLYDQNPVVFEGKHLPLTWDEFSRLRLSFSPKEQLEAFRTYYPHPIHGAWRLLDPQNQWRLHRHQFEQRRAEFWRDDNQEFIAFMWYLLNRENINQRIEMKKKEFVMMLAKCNRLENFYLEHAGDGFGRLDILNQKLWNLVVHPPKKFKCLQEDLEIFTKSYLQKKWIQRLLQLNPRDFNLLCSEWDKLLQSDDYLPEMQAKLRLFDIHLPTEVEFERNLSVVFQESWRHESKLDRVYQKLAVNTTYSQAYINASLFSQSLQKVKDKTRSLEALLKNLT